MMTKKKKNRQMMLKKILKNEWARPDIRAAIKVASVVGFPKEHPT